MRVSLTRRYLRWNSGRQNCYYAPEIVTELRYRLVALFGVHRHGASDDVIQLVQQVKWKGSKLCQVTNMFGHGFGRPVSTYPELACSIGIGALLRRVLCQLLLERRKVWLTMLDGLVPCGDTGRFMGSEGEIECSTQGVHVGTGVGTGPARILFLWCIAGGPLVTDEKERAFAAGRCFGIPQVHQDSRPIGCNANVIWFDVAVNNGWLLAMQEGNSVTDGQYPFHNTWERDGFVALAGNADQICQVVVF